MEEVKYLTSADAQQKLEDLDWCPEALRLSLLERGLHHFEREHVSCRGAIIHGDPCFLFLGESPERTHRYRITYTCDFYDSMESEKDTQSYEVFVCAVGIAAARRVSDACAGLEIAAHEWLARVVTVHRMWFWRPWWEHFIKWLKPKYAYNRWKHRAIYRRLKERRLLVNRVIGPP